MDAKTNEDLDRLSGGIACLEKIGTLALSILATQDDKTKETIDDLLASLHREHQAGEDPRTEAFIECLGNVKSDMEIAPRLIDD